MVWCFKNSLDVFIVLFREIVEIIKGKQSHCPKVGWRILSLKSNFLPLSAKPILQFFAWHQELPQLNTTFNRVNQSTDAHCIGYTSSSFFSLEGTFISYLVAARLLSSWSKWKVETISVKPERKTTIWAGTMPGIDLNFFNRQIRVNSSSNRGPVPGSIYASDVSSRCNCQLSKGLLKSSSSFEE